MVKLSKKFWSPDGGLTNPLKGAFFSSTSMFQAKNFILKLTSFSMGQTASSLSTSREMNVHGYNSSTIMPAASNMDLGFESAESKQD
uniref:Uncharacterized protein n=1 Tax=Salix viminalis TaxID=40686 RepID=A0A6N2LNT9_SALVM